MTAPAITSFAQDENGHIKTTVRADGLRTICLAHNAGVVGQLVRGRLLTKQGDIAFAPDSVMPWGWFLDDGPPWHLLATLLRSTVGDTYGVVSTDLSGAQFETDLSNIGPICFTIDCDNSKEIAEVCL